MQIWNRKIEGQKFLKNWIWNGLGLHLGGVWDALGRLGVTFGRILILLKTWVQDGLHEAFGMAFESVLGGFGPLLDTLGRLWAFFLAFKPELL